MFPHQKPGTAPSDNILVEPDLRGIERKEVRFQFTRGDPHLHPVKAACFTPLSHRCMQVPDFPHTHVEILEIPGAVLHQDPLCLHLPLLGYGCLPPQPEEEAQNHETP
jgi:hypothetical protein